MLILFYSAMWYKSAQTHTHTRAHTQTHRCHAKDFWLIQPFEKSSSQVSPVHLKLCCDVCSAPNSPSATLNNMSPSHIMSTPEAMLFFFFFFQLLLFCKEKMPHLWWCYSTCRLEKIEMPIFLSKRSWPPWMYEAFFPNAVCIDGGSLF